MKAQVFAALILGILFAGCGSKMIHTDPASATVKPGILKLWATWVKDKGAKFDMNLNMASEAEKGTVLVFLTDIGCSRGGVQGYVKHTLFNSGERNIQFSPRQGKSFNMVCYLPGKSKGEYVVTVHKVFDNPSNDGKTAGKVIAENIVWRHSGNN